MPQADTLPITQLLAQARDALKTGAFDQLADLTAGIESAIPRIGDIGLAGLQRIAAEAAENDRLLVAAQKGIRAAQRRARDLTDQGRFSTYDQGGQRAQPGLTNAQSTRRA